MTKTDDRMPDDSRLGEEAFNRASEDIMGSIRLCLEYDLPFAALSLLYGGIDAMAWLNCPKGQQRARRRDFIAWARQYLLPDAGLPCNAEDLYAARCGILHTRTPDSDLSHSGKAKPIYYAYAALTTQELRRRLDRTEHHHDVLVVHIDNLVEALQTGLQEFRQAVSKDPALAERVYSRTRRLLALVRWPKKAAGD